MKKILALMMVIGLSVPAFAADKPKPTPEEAFAKLDKNSDKLVSKEEFVGKKTGEKLTAAEAMFKKKDKNSDGSLDLEEFKAGGKKPK